MTGQDLLKIGVLFFLFVASFRGYWRREAGAPWYGGFDALAFGMFLWFLLAYVVK